MIQVAFKSCAAILAVALLLPRMGVAETVIGQSAADFSKSQLAIQPMTKIGAGEVGYFEDPYPVRLAPSRAAKMVIFSGTTKAIMQCQYPLSAGCFSWTPARIDIGTLDPAIAAANAQFTNFQNLNVFQDDAGGWHAVLAIGVKKRGASGTNHWTVLVHAHPSTEVSPETVPLSWSADTVLSGSFATEVQGNYDGKYLEVDGKLYLLYVKNLVPEPALRNGIAIRPMLSFTRPASEPPTTLLTPGDRFGPLNSEWYDHTKAKLVEAPYIVTIGDKFALIYSTGAYQHADYKAGVAWSDTLVPPPGRHYRKVLQPDSQGIWGRPGQPEVHYLLQSQKRGWPNFTPGEVYGPGVASALQAPDGVWNLFFAGYDQEDRPVSTSSADAKHRRPFFVPLRASIPAGQSVATASDADLVNWLEPKTR